MTALQRALTLVQVHDIAVTIGHHLDFDVARLFDELFHEDAIVTEARTRFVCGALETVAALVIVTCDTHAFATTTRAGLEHDGVANVSRDLHGVIAITQHIGEPGDRIDASLIGQFLRRDFVAHRFDGVRLRTDKRNAFLAQRFAKR